MIHTLEIVGHKAKAVYIEMLRGLQVLDRKSDRCQILEGHVGSPLSSIECAIQLLARNIPHILSAGYPTTGSNSKGRSDPRKTRTPSMPELSAAVIVIVPDGQVQIVEAPSVVTDAPSTSR